MAEQVVKLFSKELQENQKLTEISERLLGRLKSHKVERFQQY